MWVEQRFAIESVGLLPRAQALLSAGGSFPGSGGNSGLRTE